MGKTIELMMQDDGTFTKYNDEFDITVHCESKEEQEEFIEKVNEGLKAISRQQKIREIIDKRNAMKFDVYNEAAVLERISEVLDDE